MNFSSFSISQKLYTSFIGASLLTLLVGFIGFYGFHTATDSLEMLGNSDLKLLRISEKISTAMLNCRRFEKNAFIRSSNKALRTKELERFSAEFQKIQTLSIQLHDMLANDEDISPAIIAKSLELPALLTKYEEVFRKVNAQIDADPAAMTAAKADEAMASAIDAIRSFEQINEEIQVAIDKMVQTTASDAISSNASHSSTMVVVSIFGLAIVLSFGVLFTRNLVKILSSTTNALSEGSDQVASASHQISAASQSLAEGASEQAASLEETSASLEEISSMTKRNAENAVSAKDLANETRAVAEEGSSNMTEMNHAMTDIQSASDNIAKIIKTIDEIAFQTNILALNAAVEAARAGEAGAGFAVVADEVRNLAQRSAQAAKETADKIEDSIRKSANGVQISAKVTSSLTQIVTKARQVDELVAEIATASREQSQGIDQVNMAVTQMDKVTQSNAASAEETASASEQLNAQAATLRDLVGNLQTLVNGDSRGNAPATPPRPPSSHTQPLSSRPYTPPRRSTSPQTKPSSSRPSLSHSSRPALPPSRKRSPQEEIPLEDGFKDF